MSFTYEYPRPAVTVDIVLATTQTPQQVLLIKRAREPFRDHWALPGGFVDQDEDLKVAARRELLEETGIDTHNMRQFGAYGTPGRDPRGHTVSIVYCVSIGSTQEVQARAADDASEAEFFAVDDLPPLAFDHQQILNDVFGNIGT